MPTLRKFFKHFAPRLMGSSSPSAKRPGPSPHGGGSALDRIRRQRRYAHFDDDDDDYDYGTGVGSSKSRNGQGIDVSSELQDFARPSRDARTGRTARIDAAPPLPSLVGTGAGAGVGGGSGGSGSRSANRDDHSEKAILQTRTFTVQYDDD